MVIFPITLSLWKTCSHGLPHLYPLDTLSKTHKDTCGEHINQLFKMRNKGALKMYQWRTFISRYGRLWARLHYHRKPCHIPYLQIHTSVLNLRISCRRIPVQWKHPVMARFVGKRRGPELPRFQFPFHTGCQLFLYTIATRGVKFGVGNWNVFWG